MKKVFSRANGTLTTSIKSIDYRLLGVLILTGLLPTVYTTFRINLLGDLPGEWGYNIASQLSWLNVAYEVVQEALLLPMFFLIGKHPTDRARVSNVVTNGLLLVITLYAILSALTIVFARPMIVFMAQAPELIDATVSYIRLEAIALDAVLLSSLPFSLQLGVTGIVITSIAVNVTLVVLVVWLLRGEGLRLFASEFSLDWSWLKEWLRTGGLSGLESLDFAALSVLDSQSGSCRPELVFTSSSKRKSASCIRRSTSRTSSASSTRSAIRS